MAAINLDASLGTFTSNSFVTSEYGDEYWNNHYNQTKASQWQGLGQTQKDHLLIQACRILETARFTIKVSRADYALRYNRLTGTVVDMSYLWREPVKWYFYQRLQFPRNLDVNPADGSLYIPPEIQMAQCEQAVYLMTFDDTALANRLQGIVLDKVGVGRGQVDLTQEYASDGSSFSPMAFELCRPYFVKNVRLKRA